MRDTDLKPRAIAWYRTPLDPKALKALHLRDEGRAAFQTLGYLGLLALTGTAAVCAAGRLPAEVVLLLFFLHGTCYAFQINAVHELGHGTVFRSKFLNKFFVRVFAFLGWINFECFEASHARHHRYTLHQPDDLEVVLPMKVVLRDFLLQGFINIQGFWAVLKDTSRIACGHFQGEWELALFPESNPERRAPINWARTVLAGHTLIIVLSAYFHLWLLPVVTTRLPPFTGGGFSSSAIIPSTSACRTTLMISGSAAARSPCIRSSNFSTGT